jgi:glycosyltransferase involved in cell wall biosynthesis
VTEQSEPRVALVAHSVHDHGGMERAFSELIRGADGRFRLTVVAGELDLPPHIRAKVDWRKVPIPRRPIPLRFAIFFVLGALRLARARADLVHTMGAIVPNRADLASVHFCHAGFSQAGNGRSAPSSLPRRLNGALSRAVALVAERWCYRIGRVRALAAVSNGVGGEVRRYYPGVPVFVTPNGVDADRFRPDPRVQEELRRAEGVGARDVVALFIGGDWHRKGLAITIEAVARAASETGVALWLWVVGDGESGRLSQLARAHGIAERVRFFGSRTDTERFYQAADVFVLASSYETFSIAAYEAAASELPVVSTRVSGVEELVGADEAGVLVERDAPELGAALARLGSDAALRAQMGKVGRERVREFTWQRSAESVLALYENLLAERPVTTERRL